MLCRVDEENKMQLGRILPQEVELLRCRVGPEQHNAIISLMNHVAAECAGGTTTTGYDTVRDMCSVLGVGQI